MDNNGNPGRETFTFTTPAIVEPLGLVTCALPVGVLPSTNGWTPVDPVEKTKPSWKGTQFPPPPPDRGPSPTQNCRAKSNCKFTTRQRGREHRSPTHLPQRIKRLCGGVRPSTVLCGGATGRKGTVGFTWSVACVTCRAGRASCQLARTYVDTVATTRTAEPHTVNWKGRARCQPSQLCSTTWALNPYTNHTAGSAPPLRASCQLGGYVIDKW